MPLRFLNGAAFRPVAYSNTDDFEVDSAVTGYHLPLDAANPATEDGAIYHYFAISDDGSQYEEGDAAWDESNDTLLRSSGTVRNGSSGPGTKITFSAAPKVVMGGATAGDWPFSGEAPDDETITIRAGDSTFDGGGVNIFSGAGGVSGGNFNFQAGPGETGQGGSFAIQAGDGDVEGGAFTAAGGSSTSGPGGSVNLQPGGGATDGGDVRVTLPSAGSGRQGRFYLINVETGDPVDPGAVYVDGSGFLKVSL